MARLHGCSWRTWSALHRRADFFWRFSLCLDPCRSPPPSRAPPFLAVQPPALTSLQTGCRFQLPVLQPPFPYAGRPVALATCHGKERVLRRPFRAGLGVEIIVASGFDTDSLGTFSGERPRPADAATTCRLKAEAALDATGASLGLASEGSFGPHPAIPFLPLAIEWMTFVDRHRDLVISERLVGPPTNFSHSVIAAGADPGSWLERIGFPAHGVIVRPHRSDLHRSDPFPIVRGLQCRQALDLAIRGAVDHSADGLALLETDMRAHRNPTRMDSIRRLAFRLVRRIRTPCSSCGCPGWGLVGREPGLPCGWCGLPTALLRAEIHGCAHCDHRAEVRRRDGLLRADPQHCANCNP